MNEQQPMKDAVQGFVESLEALQMFRKCYLTALQTLWRNNDQSESVYLSEIDKPVADLENKALEGILNAVREKFSTDERIEI